MTRVLSRSSSAARLAPSSSLSRAVDIVLVADLDPDRHWLHWQGFADAVYQRLRQDGLSVRWHAERPARGSRKRHEHYQPVPPSVMFGELLSHGLRVARRTAKRVLQGMGKSNPCRRFSRIVSQRDSLRLLVAQARSAGVQRMVLVRDDQVALTSEGIALALRAAEEQRADLLVCTQLEGLLPTVVSVDALARALEKEPNLSVSALERPESWARSRDADAANTGFAHVVDLALLDSSVCPGPVRCRPQDAHEKLLVRYWDDHRHELAEALRHWPDEKRLADLIGQYRATIAPALPTYHVHGSLGDVQDVRRKMKCSQKPLLDYFVIATHYGQFLQRYAGLKPSSHVVDIGCSWGYLALALANLLLKDGAYLGIEVQEPAVAWAHERLAWLGDNFQFVHLDIHNDFYNPGGATPRGRVRLPVGDRWADVVVAGSVFTHMQPDGVQGYFAELRRILRPGGIAAFSYLDSTAFWSGQEHLCTVQNVPDEVTVYSRQRIAGMLAAAGLTAAREPVNMRQFGRTDYQTWYFATPG